MVFFNWSMLYFYWWQQNARKMFHPSPPPPHMCSKNHYFGVSDEKLCQCHWKRWFSKNIFIKKKVEQFVTLNFMLNSLVDCYMVFLYSSLLYSPLVAAPHISTSLTCHVGSSAKFYGLKLCTRLSQSFSPLEKLLPNFLSPYKRLIVMSASK
jgi:hypothetical protein